MQVLATFDNWRRGAAGARRAFARDAHPARAVAVARAGIEPSRLRGVETRHDAMCAISSGMGPSPKGRWLWHRKNQPGHISASAAQSAVAKPDAHFEAAFGGVGPNPRTHVVQE